MQDDTDDECPMCGGDGGWPGVNGWVACKPCKGTGKNKLPLLDAGVELQR